MSQDNTQNPPLTDLKCDLKSNPESPELPTKSPAYRTPAKQVADILASGDILDSELRPTTDFSPLL